MDGLDGPESLPWVPLDPESRDSEYVPPGLNALITGTSPARPCHSGIRPATISSNAVPHPQT